MSSTAVPGEPVLAPVTRDLPVPSGRDVAWTALGGLGGMAVGLVAVLVPVLLLGGKDLVALALLASAVAGGAGLWLALGRRRGWGLAELGFVRGRRSLWHLLWEVPLLLVVGLLATVLAGTALGLAPEPAPEGGSADLVSGALDASPWAWALGVACIVLLVPAVEEVVFRRVLLGWLRTRVPVWAAVVLVAVAFGAVHVAPAAVLYLTTLGLSAALLMVWHRSLWAPLALHATNNALASLVAVTALTS